MRIGINASFARKPASGIGQVTVNFLHELIRQNPGDEFFVYLEEDLPKGFKLPQNFRKRIFLPLWRRDDLIRAIWWQKYLLPKKVREDDCQVFFSLYQCATVLPAKIKHVMLVHDVILEIFHRYLDNRRKKYFWRITKDAIRRCTRIIAVSRRTEKDLVQKLNISPTKISVCHVDVDEIYKKRPAKDTESKIMKKYGLVPGYIYNGGGLEVRKNTESVLRAYKFLLDQNHERKFTKKFPQLVISGKLLPELKPLVFDAETAIKKMNLTGQVKLLGFVPQAHLPVIYKNASMFVYPSLYEGFGLPVLEAMNQKVPVITAKTSSLPEIGGDGVLYCDPYDFRDLAMVMKNILLNKGLRIQLSQRAFLRAQAFAWHKFVDKFLHIAHERISGKN